MHSIDKMCQRTTNDPDRANSDRDNSDYPIRIYVNTDPDNLDQDDSYWDNSYLDNSDQFRPTVILILSPVNLLKIVPPEFQPQYSVGPNERHHHCRRLLFQSFHFQSRSACVHRSIHSIQHGPHSIDTPRQQFSFAIAVYPVSFAAHSKCQCVRKYSRLSLRQQYLWEINPVFQL